MKKPGTVAFLSTYPPEECGIATFTYDLVNAIDQYFPYFKTRIIAMEESDKEYEFDDKVIFKIKDSEPEDYILIAKCVNESNIDIINIQHEFGIFGGKEGEYLELFLNNVEKPVVTTLHTVLPQPEEGQKKMIQKIAQKSEKLVALSNTAVQFLNNSYRVPEKKITVIHHGVPVYDSLSKKEAKLKFGLSDKIVVSTFGLINPGKGIEYVIEAVSLLVERYPNIIYLILGKTHPKAKKFYGEEYRERLMKQVKDLNIENNVVFVNKYLTKEELLEYLTATDIYITPYLNRDQICSGTLAYAMGLGKAVISTPYLYAEEMLRDRRGILVEFRNSKAIFKAIDKILKDPEFMKTLEKNALNFGKQMRWPYVAFKYVDLFKSLIGIPKTVEISY
ncbi:MAG TPA: glycosyltransferase family 4 protein [Dictyoglomaceae bacterium]|nr:glycosyltransferase family 4 protein [Dictyoglomaceae bacterium]HOL40139.1 glycosyltransferase family 4 protein [Dictyoglomaceae bacterium]HPP16512.1 glycosyltransferase family 4 protein [Dictyoglomaceae bacterium]